MASSSRTVRVRFDGDAGGLVASSAVAESALDRLGKRAKSVNDFFSGPISKLAMFAPVAGYAAGTAVALGGALGLLPAVGLAGGLAIGGLKVATSGFGDAIKAVGDPAKFAEAVGKLSPNAQEAARAVQGLNPRFQELKKSAQDALFDGLGPIITNLGQKLLPQLDEGFTRVAGGANFAATETAGYVGSTRGMGAVEAIVNGSANTWENLTASIRPIVQVILDVGAVGAQMLPGLTQGAAGAAQRFADFVAKARDTGQLRTWIQQGIDVFRQLWQVISTLVQVVFNLAAAFGSSGFPSALQLIADGLLRMSQFIRDNATVMVPLITAIGLFVAAVKVAAAVVGFFQTLSTIISAVRGATMLWTAAQWLLNIALSANPIGLVIIAVAALIAIVVLIIANWDTVKQWFSVFWTFLTGIFQVGWNAIRNFTMQVVGAVVGWVIAQWTAFQARLAAIWSGVRNGVSAAWNAVVSFIQGAISRAVAFIGQIAQIPGRVGAWFQDMRARAVAAATQLVSWLSGLPGRIVSAIGRLGSILTGAGRDLLDGLWRGIQAGWSWLQGMVGNLARSLLNAAKAALGIASPSKRFRDEVGRWVPEGMAIGITANTSAVTDAARDLAGRALTATSSLTVGAAGVGSAYAATGTAAAAGVQGGPTYVTVKIGETELRAMIVEEQTEQRRELVRSVSY